MYQRILIPTDGSALADKAVVQGLELARQLGASAVALRVMAPPSALVMEGVVVAYPVDEMRKEAMSQIATQMHDVEELARKVGVALDTRTAESDQAWRAIIETAEAEGVDLIVMASHGRRGVSALVLGSETHKVLTHTSIPVLVCR